MHLNEVVNLHSVLFASGLNRLRSRKNTDRKGARRRVTFSIERSNLTGGWEGDEDEDEEEEEETRWDKAGERCGVDSWKIAEVSETLLLRIPADPGAGSRNKLVLGLIN